MAAVKITEKVVVPEKIIPAETEKRVSLDLSWDEAALLRTLLSDVRGGKVKSHMSIYLALKDADVPYAHKYETEVVGPYSVPLAGHLFYKDLDAANG